MISVIIPVLNEAKILDKTLSQLQPELVGHELIVVDGGSTDNSVQIAEKYGRVITSKQGRAKQLNAGAASANGNILIFLHADVWLENGAFKAVESALASDFIGGGFHQKIDGKSYLYRIIEFTADMRGKYLKVFYGDSGIFVRRTDFQKIGGFPDVPIMEEMGFSNELRRLGKTKMIRPHIHISARRWERNGIVRTTAKNWLITFLYYIRVSPDKLAKLYRNIR